MQYLKTLRKNGFQKYLSLWNGLTGWKKFMFYALHYTLLFALISRYVFSDFVNEERTFIAHADAIRKYMPNLIYISQTLRDGIQALLRGEGWTIPLYDFRIMPLPQALEGELLALLAVFCPWDRIDEFYNILVLLRYYLMGLSFSALGFYFRQRSIAILIGAISYVFCGHSLHAGTTHPYFLSMAIFLPLLVLGAEQVLQRKKGYLFICVVFLASISSLYFACMQAILIIEYFLVRYFFVYREKGIRGFGSLLGRMTLWGGTGLLIGASVVVPSLFQMLDTGRIGRDPGNLFWYPMDFYQQFVARFTIEPSTLGSWSFLGFSILTIPTVILLLVWKKPSSGQQSLRVLFVILTAMFCSPLAGYVMSGFAISYNRWGVGYSLCVCFIITYMLPEICKNIKSRLPVLGLGITFYILICHFMIEEKNRCPDAEEFLLILLLLFGACALLGKDGQRILMPLCLGVTCFSVCYSSYVLFDPLQQNYVNNFLPNDSFYPNFMSGQYASLGQSKIVREDDDFFRVAVSDLHTTRGHDANLSFYWGLNGTSNYGMTPVSPYRIMQSEMEIMQRGESILNYGNDGRASLLSALNVKYYAARGREPYPYGFEPVETIQNGQNQDIILENHYVLPIGYTYEGYMLEKDYQNMSALEKQDAIMQAVVLSEPPISKAIVKQEPISEAIPISVKVDASNGVNWVNGNLEVEKEDASLVLQFHGDPDSDTYLRVVNLDLTNGGSGNSWYLTAETSDSLTYTRFMADGNLYTTGAKTQLLYLGHPKNGYTSCTITFPQKGSFDLEDLQIWCQPMENYADWIDTLREETLEDVETNFRGLTGNISVSEDSMLCLSIPYDQGWTAYVDGEKAKIYQANTAFMAVEISAGIHEIEMRYCPRGLKAGLALSVAGITVFIALACLQHNDGRRKGNV